MKKVYVLGFVTLLTFSQDVSNLIDELKSNQLQSSFQSLDQVTTAPLPEQIDQKQEENQKDLKQKKSKYFAFDYLRTLSTNLKEPYSTLPVNNDYKLSFNDNLRIILSGSKSQIINTRVGFDGAILIPQLGRIQVVGKSFAELSSSIASLVAASYVGVNVDISVIDLSAKKISIIGAVKNPGVYLVNPYTTISNSLAYVDGLEEYASLRNLKLVKSTGEVSYFDLYELIIKGDRTKDLVLSSGDTVVVGATNNYVALEGAIHREFIYEYKSTDSYENLIDFALGKTTDSVDNKMFVDYLNDNVIETKEVKTKDKIGDTILERLFIPKKTSFNLRDIKVTGDALEDGYYSPEDYKYLHDLFIDLKKSDDFYPFFGFLQKNNPYTLERNLVIFNTTDLEQLKKIELGYNDELFFFTFREIQQFNAYKNYLQENELLTNEDATEEKSFDEIFFSQDLFEEDKIERFGNFYTDETLFDLLNSNLLAINYGIFDIEYLPVGPDIIPRLILDYLPFEFNIGSLNAAKISSNEGHSKKADLDTPINNLIGASITIPSDDVDFYEVEIRGYVATPGKYKISRDTTLQEFYEIVGGFLTNADQSSIVFQREKIKERERVLAKKARLDILDTLISSLSNVSSSNPPQIDASLLAFYQETQDLDFFGRFVGDISNNSVNAKTITLEDLDYIYVPPMSNSISVIGQVQNQITVNYEANLAIDDYINMAGGLTSYADRSNIYIVSSNGISRSAGKKMFKNDEYFLSPGDTIVVPREFGQIKGTALATVAISILSDLALSAASLNAISR